jgi:adenine phosphoribosyltransferase
MDLKEIIRTIPDFPKPGIQFRDITTLLKNAEALRESAEKIADAYRGKAVDYVAGIESRGFIVGALVAYLLNAGFVPVRKKGKLPGATIEESYALEYGTGVLEIHDDCIEPGSQIVIVDDLLATGGTALAASKLVEKAGGVVLGMSFIVNLPDLQGAARIEQAGYALRFLVEFDGD